MTPLKMSWSAMDHQMAFYATELQAELKLSDDSCRKLATTIAAEVRFLPMETKIQIRLASPVPMSVRFEELLAFQRWMDLAHKANNPILTRAQVITQNYICFVYLSEACFAVLRKKAPIGSISRRCAKYLTDNPVRSFRNAVAHSNWQYKSDFGGLIYWSRKGDEKDEPLTKFEVDRQKLNFWQSLSRCVAYAMYQSLD
jgi:hypothetical protein